MIIDNGSPRQSLNEIVLFPFDDYSIPFQNGVQLNLVGYATPSGNTRIVLGLGPEGAPDSVLVVYYGTVHRVGDELWMWYLGQGPDNTWFERVCFAKSRDGYHWERPNLGLVEYRGSKDNNLVDLNQGGHHVQACVVFYEPEDGERPFKMVFESNKYDKKFAAAYSLDGLTWQEYANNPVGPWFEMAGGIKLNGCYYLAGQGGNHVGGLRQLATCVSYDFAHWTTTTCMGLRRNNLPPRPVPFGNIAGERVHLGAALWNRGNVIVGFYGMWHGHPSSDRRLLTMDLGLAVTNDALHYREPVPDFPIVLAAEDGLGFPQQGNTAHPFPALIQGQGFENIGDETLFWYAPWPEHDSDGVRVARWTRDRLGYFDAFTGPRMARGESHFISAPIDLEGRTAHVALNLDGVSEYSHVRVEVLDEWFNPIPGLSGDASPPMRDPGLRQPVLWRDGEQIAPTTGRIRLKVDFEGIRFEDARLYAVYLEQRD